MKDINTVNKFLVAANGQDSVMMLKPPAACQPLSKDEALIHAAWIVALVNDRARFDEILAAVEES